MIDRLRLLGIFIILGMFVIIARLAYVQIVLYETYKELTSGTYDLSKPLPARRGEIFVSDIRSGDFKFYPIALNRDKFTLISNNRKISNATSTAELIISRTSSTPDLLPELVRKLSDGSRAYQPLLIDVKEEYIRDTLAAANDADLNGAFYSKREPARLYPEKNIMSHITGFLGRTETAQTIGRYGVEGFFDKELAGEPGYIRTAKDPTGSWIPLADRNLKDPVDGRDLILTIDRSVQFTLCTELERGSREYAAHSATGIILNPKTGEIIAMCSYPHFDPNQYQKISDSSVFNNDAVFRAYEPGSVFKIITMSAALDAGAVTPDTSFADTGSIKRDGKTIKNAADKKWGTQNMTGVIKESINTGAVFAAEALGLNIFREYVDKFGFGKKTNIEIQGEEKGNIKSLQKKGAVYLATASFGQGITATPIQIVSAFGALANKGIRHAPTVLYGWRSQDGRIERSTGAAGERIVSEKTAQQISAMLVTVVKEGHGKRAAVAGYTIGGKTGTAQIASAGGGYGKETNHTFVGYGPMSDPRFVMLIKYEAPQRTYAESTAVPTFGIVAKFLLEYLGVPPEQF